MDNNSRSLEKWIKEATAIIENQPKPLNRALNPAFVSDRVDLSHHKDDHLEGL